MKQQFYHSTTTRTNKATGERHEYEVFAAVATVRDIGSQDCQKVWDVLRRQVTRLATLHCDTCQYYNCCGPENAGQCPRYK